MVGLKSPYVVQNVADLLEIQWKQIQPAKLPVPEILKYLSDPKRCAITERLNGLAKLKELYENFHKCADLREQEGDDCFEKLGIPESAMAVKMIKRQAYHLGRKLRQDAGAILKCAQEFWGPDGIPKFGTDLETMCLNSLEMQTSDKIYTKAFGVAQQAEKEVHHFDAVMTKIFADYRREYCIGNGIREPFQMTMLNTQPLGAKR